MVRTRAREGITGLVRALRGRWLSSRRWLCETVVWACDDPWPKWECINPFADMDSTGLDAQEPAWPDTEIRAFTLAAASEPLPLEQLPSMERYPGLDYSTCVIEPGKAAYARHANGADACGVYTVGDPHSLIVVASLLGCAGGRVCTVRVAHWQDDTPMAEIDGFFISLCAEWEVHGRIDLCIVEGCDGSFRTPAVIDHAWALGIYPCYHASVAPVFGIAADPHGRVYCGDSPGLKAFLEARYASASRDFGCPSARSQQGESAQRGVVSN